MTTYYLDTSVAVHALFGTSGAVAWFEEVVSRPDDRLVSSRILRTELTRVLRRESRPVAQRDEVLDHISLVRLGEQILASAEAITEHVTTLDAIHLASAVATGAGTVLVTHDIALRSVAEVLGFETVDPLDDEVDGEPWTRMH